MNIVRDKTYFVTSPDGSAIHVWAKGAWHESDIVRGVLRGIVGSKSENINIGDELNLLEEAGKTIVNIHGDPVIIPKQEAIEKRGVVEKIKPAGHDKFWIGYAIGLGVGFCLAWMILH